MGPRGRMWLRMMIVLMLIGGVSTDCAWLKRMRQSPRQHWWEFWKPKRPKSGDLYYPKVEEPPPPPVFEPQAGTEAPVPIEQPAPTAPTEAPLGVPETQPPRVPPAGMVKELQMVHFAFDSYALSPEAKRILDENAKFILAHPELQILVEGHCDERGTQEYNLNLGQKRADAVREYLISKGVPPDQLHTISYGEERPLDPGHNEAAWAKNRRVQFQVYQ